MATLSPKRDMTVPVGALPLGSIAGGRLSTMIPGRSGEPMSHIFIDAAGMRRTVSPGLRLKAPPALRLWHRVVAALFAHRTA